MFQRISLLSAALAAAVVAAAPASASDAAPCSPNASLLGFTDALDKTTFGGLTVGGLSALAPTGGSQALALTDNQGATPARFFTLKLRTDRGRVSAETTRATTLRRPDGTAFTGQNFDGEGLVVEPGGTLLVSSETEPAIRRFDRDGTQVDQLAVPPRFGIAPNGQGATNQSFEGLGLTADGKTLFAGMEGPLSADGASATGRARLRILRYDRARRGDFVPGAQYAYLADPALAITEVVPVGDDSLLVLERGFASGVGNTVRVYRAFLAGATDVSGVSALTDSSPFLYKQLLFDVGACPAGGATNPGPQPNPLLDNIEGMALGDKLAGGRRELLLMSDDNFSATQVTRIYSFSVALRDEPVLEGRAFYSATQLQPGPPAGQSGVGANNGVTPPFAGQPIPGFSGVLPEGNDRFLAMPDNGFGTKGNSRDFLLRVYRIRTDWRSKKIEVYGFLQLRDPDNKIPFDIVNETTPERLLTGGDFDVEAIARDRKGDLWFGEEFGPYLLRTDATGKVLDAPYALPGGKSPSSPDLAPGEPATVRGSRGWEAVAASPDGRYLYPMLEGYRLDDAVQTRRWIYEFDVNAKRYTGRRWQYRTDDPEAQIGDMMALGDRRFLLIERDDLEGAPAKLKNIVTIDLDEVDGGGYVEKETVLDLLRIRDPFGISLPARAGEFGVGDPFSYPLQSVEVAVPLGKDRVFVVNDNNLPDSDGRIAGKVDDVEAIVVRVPGGLDR